ncbi:UNVERIFIED_ORG: phasin [Rhizobium esperanzae]|uniref:phasin n=1 Tax=Rhizobium phaseoli TaxID=396 RepID=UPI0002D6C274|nr:phasin [Rhizobium phaseoli]ANM02913.1 phasin 2 family protein [Rhizobium phaseoli]PDS33538.1 phasin [Rhizobium phaseoli]
MATIKTDDVFSIASFDPSKLAESFREFAEKGAQQSKDAYAKLKTAGEEAGKTLEATVQTAQAGTVEIGLKAIDVLRVNAESSLSHMEALLGVKSVAEFVELQTSFLRKQAELAVNQAKAMQETTKQVAEKLAKPSKEAAEKAMASFKVA